MNKLFICIGAVFLFLAGFYSCDSTTAPDEILKDLPVVTQFSVSPNEIVFTQDQGFADTTITITVNASFSQPFNTNVPLVVIHNKQSNEIVNEQPMTPTDSGNNSYFSEVEISTTTTSFEHYIVNLIYDEESGNYAQTFVSVNGFSNAPPVILETYNPPTASLPSAGTKPIAFTAKVTDADGQTTLEGVYLDLISQVTGAVNQFELFDDGTSGNDAVANDSTFTVTLEIDPTRQLQSYDIHYFAIDKGGLSSDTIKTTFSIVE